MNVKMLTMVSVIAIVFASFAMIDVDADDPGFTITDGEGVTHVYDGPSDHIVSTGAAVTHTFKQLGVLDKIVATDNYGSKDYAEGQFNEDYSELNAINLGGIFSSDIVDSFEAELPKLVEQGKLCLDDTIILTTSSKIYDIKDVLVKHGFTHVLLYKSIDDYDTIVEMMETLSLVSTGKVDERVKDMRESKDRISQATAEMEPAKALVVWYNSSGVSVGNVGIMSSMLEICNAEQIGLDKTIDKGYYGGDTDIVQLIGENRDATVFINYSYFDENTLQDFRDKYLGGDESIELVQMGPLWNNYCFEVGDALNDISEALYGDIDGSAGDGESDSNMLLYVGLALVVIIIVAAVAYFMMRCP